MFDLEPGLLSLSRICASSLFQIVGAELQKERAWQSRWSELVERVLENEQITGWRKK